MSKNRNNNSKSNVATATPSVEQTGNVNALVSTMEAAPAVKVESETTIIRPLEALNRLFTIDGETMRLRSDLSDIEKPSAEELASVVADRIGAAQTATMQGVWGLYEASQLGGIIMDSVCARLAMNGTNSTTLSNMRHVATRVIPLQLKHEYKGGVSLLKDHVAVMHDSKGETLTTPLSIELQKAFLSGKNPEGLVIVNPKTGLPKDVSGEDISTVSLRALRAKFDKDGQPKAVALPGPTTPALTTQQRSASESNATPGAVATAETEAGAIAQAQAGTPLVNESEKPTGSAGNTPATTGKPQPGKPLTEAEQITAAASALRLRFESLNASHTWKKDERDEIVAALVPILKSFGAEVLGL